MLKVTDTDTSSRFPHSILIFCNAAGMNPTLRAIVRTGIYCGCQVYYIKEGYSGLLAGGEHIEEATWDSVSCIIHKVGRW